MLRESKSLNQEIPGNQLALTYIFLMHPEVPGPEEYVWDLLIQIQQIKLNSMIRNIVLSIALIIVMLLPSCAPTKKVTKTDSSTSVETVIKKLDTTKTEAAWKSVIDNVISQIDLTKIKIVTYYPNVDSTGKQAIKEEISIEKNIATNAKTNSTEKAILTEDKGIKEDSSQKFQNRDVEKVNEKKSGIPIKYYLIGFIVLAGIGYLAYKFLRHKFF